MIAQKSGQEHVLRHSHDKYICKDMNAHFRWNNEMYRGREAFIIIDRVAK